MSAELYDDLIGLTRDASDSHCAVIALVALLRGSNGDTPVDSLGSDERRGVAELLDCVQERLGQMANNAGQMARELRRQCVGVAA